MRHAGDSNELLEVACDELWPVVRDDTRPCRRVLFLGSLQNYLDVGLLHRLPQIPMHDRTTVPVQNAAQVIEGPADVDIGNIDVPMLMRLERLLEAGPLARRFGLPPGQEPCLLQHPPNARRTDCHNISVEHHERQPPITFQRILQMEIDDRFFFPQLQPEITGNPTVVLVDAPVALPPVIELTGGHAQPMNESSDASALPRPRTKVHTALSPLRCETVSREALDRHDDPTQ